MPPVLWILAPVTRARTPGCYFSLEPQFLLGTNNKAEDMFHTIFYANNQFSLKLPVKLIEVILNYNPKDQNIQHEMMLDEISTILQIVLSLFSVWPIWQRFGRKLDESQLSAKVIDVAKTLPSIFFYFLVCFASKHSVHKRQGKDLISPFFPPCLMHTDPADLNASLRDSLELDHIACAQPRLTQSSPFCLPSSGESHQREQKLHKHKLSQQQATIITECRWWRADHSDHWGPGQLSPCQLRLQRQQRSPPGQHHSRGNMEIDDVSTENVSIKLWHRSRSLSRNLPVAAQCPLSPVAGEENMS